MTEIKTGSDFYQNICPWIIGNEFAKRVIALQMFSNPSAGEKLNLMLIGDPAAGKTDVCRFMASCIPRSSVTDKKLTAVGLVERIIETDGGILICDEFDKIDLNCRYMLLEVMQSNTVTEDKFGVHYTKKVVLNVLVSLNPKGHLLTEAPLYMQVNFPLALSTRFHMLLPFRQIKSNHYGDLAVLHNQIKNDGYVDDLTQSIREYLKTIKDEIPHVIIDEETSRLIGNYVQNLKEYSSMGRIISPRTIQGFTSFLRARSRMMKRNKPTKEDFDYIKKIFDYAFK